jgi:hypothetical protein
VRIVPGALEPGEEMLSGYSATWSEGHEVRDERGEWDLGEDELVAGQVAGIEVTAPGYAPSIVPRAITTADWLANRIVVELGPGARVSGRVVDARDGQPVAGAIVRRATGREPNGPWGRHGDEAPIETRTDAHGAFELVGLPVETIALFVEVAGLAPALDGPFECTADTPARRIGLVPGATLVGTLRDADGRPRAQEPIRVDADAWLGLRDREWQLATDAEGRFELRDLAPGTYRVVHELKHEGGSIFDLARSITIAEPREHALELRPTGTGRIAGTVRSSGPLPRMTVSAFRRDGGPASTPRGGLALDGTFELEGLEAGRWTLILHEFGGQRALRRSGTAEVDVAEGARAVVEVAVGER